ncbi:MAG: tetratricopeptide repeat protein [Pseudomonadota bacterium]
MRRIRTCLLALIGVAVFAVGTARADQTDPSLAKLFLALHKTEDNRTAAVLTQQIWQAWLTVDDQIVSDQLNAGTAHMAANRFEEALSSFDAVIDARPDIAEGWNKRATLYFIMGDYDASAMDIAETLKREPRHFGAVSGQGYIYLRRDNHDDALKWFKRALALNPHLTVIRAMVTQLEGEATQI